MLYFRMRFHPALIAIFLMNGLSAFAESPAALELEMSAYIVGGTNYNESPTIDDSVTPILVVNCCLRNVSSESITVPTSSYDGKPDEVIVCPDHIKIIYKIGYRKGSDWTSNPSPLRFFPVTLRPGERTDLPRFQVKIDEPSKLNKLTISLKVNENYASRQGWWHGELAKEVNPFTVESRMLLKAFDVGKKAIAKGQAAEVAVPPPTPPETRTEQEIGPSPRGHESTPDKPAP